MWLVVVLLLTYGGSLLGSQATASILVASVGRVLVDHGAVLALVGLVGVAASTVASGNALERWLRGPAVTRPKERPRAWTNIVPRASHLQRLGLGVALARHEYFAFLRQWERLLPSSAAGLGLAVLPGILRAIVGEVDTPAGAGGTFYLALCVYLLPLAIAITCTAYAESVFPPRNVFPIFGLSPSAWNVSNLVRFVVLSTCTALVFAPVVLVYGVYFEKATGWLVAVAAASVVALSLMACGLQLRAGLWDHGHPRMTLVGRAGMVVAGIALGSASSGILLFGHGIGRVVGLSGALGLATLMAAGTFWSASRSFMEVRR